MRHFSEFLPFRFLIILYSVCLTSGLLKQFKVPWIRGLKSFSWYQMESSTKRKAKLKGKAKRIQRKTFVLEQSKEILQLCKRVVAEAPPHGTNPLSADFEK
jgi:hypothetical protein